MCKQDLVRSLEPFGMKAIQERHISVWAERYDYRSSSVDMNLTFTGKHWKPPFPDPAWNSVAGSFSEVIIYF